MLVFLENKIKNYAYHFLVFKIYFYSTSKTSIFTGYTHIGNGLNKQIKSINQMHEEKRTINSKIKLINSIF